MLRVITRAWREQADGRAARTLRYGAHGAGYDVLSADVDAESMARLELLTFSMARADDEAGARREARLGAWARSAVPAGTRGRAVLLHLRLVEAGRYLAARRKRMPHREATRDTRVAPPSRCAGKEEVRATAWHAVHWAGEAGPRCKAEQERANWAVKSHCTTFPAENTFRNGSEWDGRPEAKAKECREQSHQDEEGWQVPKRTRRVAPAGPAAELAVENTYMPLQEQQQDNASVSRDGHETSESVNSISDGQVDHVEIHMEEQTGEPATRQQDEEASCSKSATGKRKGRSTPVNTDEAVSSGSWRVVGWNRDGSETLAPVWPAIPDGISRPTPFKAISRAQVSKRRDFSADFSNFSKSQQKGDRGAQNDMQNDWEGTHNKAAGEIKTNTAATSARTESERVEKRKNPFVCFWDWSKAVWRGDDREGERKRARFGDG